jgi:hypothetical protein
MRRDWLVCAAAQQSDERQVLSRNVFLRTGSALLERQRLLR